MKMILALILASVQLVAGDNVTFVGGGASQTYLLYNQWASIWPSRANPGTLQSTLTYSGPGSGAGITLFNGDKVTFASTLASMPANFNNKIVLPVAIDAVVITYNIPEFNTTAFPRLVLSRQVVMNIFLGNVRFWNDPSITDLNPGLPMPNQPIGVTVRTDSGGGTTVLTETLSKVDPIWKQNVTGPNSQPAWPYVVYKGKNQDEILGKVISTPYALGYVGFEKVGDIAVQYAAIVNKAGNTVTPTEKSNQNALSDQLSVISATADQNRMNGSISDSAGADSYPFVALVYLILPQNYNSTTFSCKAIRETFRFISWSMTDSLPLVLLTQSGLTNVPPAVVDLNLQIMKRATCFDAPLFGASACDTGCAQGTCVVKGFFNDPADVCACPKGFQNLLKTDCSESQDADFVTYQEPLGVAALAFTVFVLATIVTFMAGIYIYRKTPAIKALSPLFCEIALAGLFVEALNIFLTAGIPNDIICGANLWFVSLPVGLVFAAVIVKQYRLATLFENKRRVNIAVRDERLLIYTGVLLAPCVLLLIIYTAGARPLAMKSITQAGEFAWTCQAQSTSTATAVFVMLVIYHLISMSFAIFLTLKTKDISSNFNESQGISIAIYIMASISCLVVPIMLIPQLTVRVQFTIKTFAILVACLGSVCSLFFKPLVGIQTTMKEQSASKTDSEKDRDSNAKVQFVNKNGVNVAVMATSSTAQTTQTTVSVTPPKKLQEEVWRWELLCRPFRFLGRWKKCYLVYQRELQLVSIIQVSPLSIQDSQATALCFPLSALKIKYRGTAVTGSTSGSQSWHVGRMSDSTHEELEGLVMTMKVSNGTEYGLQWQNVRQAESFANLAAGHGNPVEVEQTKSGGHHRSNTGNSTVRDRTGTGSVFQEETTVNEKKTNKIGTESTIEDPIKKSKKTNEGDDVRSVPGLDDEPKGNVA